MNWWICFILRKKISTRWRKRSVFGGGASEQKQTLKFHMAWKYSFVIFWHIFMVLLGLGTWCIHNHSVRFFRWSHFVVTWWLFVTFFEWPCFFCVGNRFVKWFSFCFGQKKKEKGTKNTKYWKNSSGKPFDRNWRFLKLILGSAAESRPSYVGTTLKGSDNLDELTSCVVNISRSWRVFQNYTDVLPLKCRFEIPVMWGCMEQ